jgi:DNA mismatch repair ATPase MutS
MQAEELKARYRKAADGFRLLAQKEERRMVILSVLRLLCFFGGIFLSWLGFTLSIAAGISVLLVSVILFLWLLKAYSAHTDNRDFLFNLSSVNSMEASALSGNLEGFVTGEEFADIDHPFSNDTDLFGKSSLFRYINRTVTSYGREILAGWLSDPFPLAEDLKKRQEVVKELAGKEKWRHEFMASGYKNGLEKKEIVTLLAWLNEKDDNKGSILRKSLLFILPGAAVISLILVIAGIFHYSVFTFFFLINLFYVFSGVKNTNRIHNALSRKYYYLSSMKSLLRSFDNEDFNSELLKEVKSNLSGKGVSAAASVKELERLIQTFDSRLNLLVSFALNGLLLWDYHSVRQLGEWKARYGSYFPVWLEMLGRIDAFISIGNFSFNNPSYVFPSLPGGTIMFSAKKLGHPLIAAEERVSNDFEIAGKGRICVITGANMAGKSTFLRTMAVNYILAMTGAPVCASELRFSPVKLFTSMRTTDSLSNHESYFYAELKRLRLLKSEVENGEPVLFILDEILKGTNSADKSLGSKLFVKRLIESGGTGLIATHDISLGELESDYPGKVFNKCFEVEIDGENIRFDYILREGVTHKMNAALLMKQMGILD